MGSFLRLATSTTLTALAVPFYLRWSGQQVNQQLDKMQKAVHFTPGPSPRCPPLWWPVPSGSGSAILWWGGCCAWAGWRRRPTCCWACCWA